MLFGEISDYADGPPMIGEEAKATLAKTAPPTNKANIAINNTFFINKMRCSLLTIAAFSALYSHVPQKATSATTWSGLSAALWRRGRADRGRHFPYELLAQFTFWKVGLVQGVPPVTGRMIF